MDLKSQILNENSRSNSEKIADWIGTDQGRLEELMNLFFNSEYRVVQRAAWTLSIVADKNPQIIKPFLKPMLEYLNPSAHVAVKRNIIRILQEQDLPEDLTGIAADKLFKFLADRKEPIAIRVFSLTVLGNIVVKFPELEPELRILIENELPYGTPAFKSRGRKLLAKLDKLSKTHFLMSK
jgi:hypothetical protein